MIGFLAAASLLIIAHRGDSGERPEHTLGGYRQAIELGADFIEPDLVMTKDGVLVARHENEIGGTTDVGKHAEFAGRKTTKAIEGKPVTGWFTEDFTLAELKTLRARERLPELRGTAHDGEEEIPTFAEVLALVKTARRPVGIYPETKHPGYFRKIGLPLEERLAAMLTAAGYDGPDDPVFVQSFEQDSLVWLHSLTKVRLVRLLDVGDKVDAEALAEIATVANAIGPDKAMVIPRVAGRLGTATTLVADAHAAGLKVHPYTFRRENVFLPDEFRRGGDPKAAGDLAGEICAYVRAGIDGLFSDNPREAVAARRGC